MFLILLVISILAFPIYGWTTQRECFCAYNSEVNAATDNILLEKTLAKQRVRFFYPFAS
jgi:hypothetical protein